MAGPGRAAHWNSARARCSHPRSTSTAVPTRAPASTRRSCRPTWTGSTAWWDSSGGTAATGSGCSRRLGPQARQVDHDGLLAAAGDDHDRLVGARVLLAMRDVRGNEDVVARRGLQADLLVTVGEDERRGAGDHVDRRLRLAVMVVARLRPRRHVGLAHPELLRARALARDRLPAGHPRGLAGVAAHVAGPDVGQRPVPVVIDHGCPSNFGRLASAFAWSGATLPQRATMFKIRLRLPSEARRIGTILGLLTTPAQTGDTDEHSQRPLRSLPAAAGPRAAAAPVRRAAASVRAAAPVRPAATL